MGIQSPKDFRKRTSSHTALTSAILERTTLIEDESVAVSRPRHSPFNSDRLYRQDQLGLTVQRAISGRNCYQHRLDRQRHRQKVSTGVQLAYQDIAYRRVPLDEDDQFGPESSSTKSDALLVANSLQADEINKRTKVEDSYKPTKRASVFGPFAEFCLPIGGV